MRKNAFIVFVAIIAVTSSVFAGSGILFAETEPTASPSDTQQSMREQYQASNQSMQAAHQDGREIKQGIDAQVRAGNQEYHQQMRQANQEARAQNKPSKKSRS